jgi:hypothetical protein
MFRSKLTIAALMITFGLCPPASAQVTVDVAKITCEQFTLYKVDDPKKIAIWIRGYYDGKRNNTVVDTQQFDANLRKITDYCIRNPSEPVLHAVETVFGPPK